MVGVIGNQSASPVSLSRPQVLPGGGSQGNHKEAGNAGLAVDTYSGNSEAWRNRATSAARGQVACRCGNCPACATQAYASQAGLDSAIVEQEDSEQSAPVLGQDGPEQEQGMVASSDPKGVDGEVLTPEEQARVVELKKIDQDVRAHEQAHMAAAGGLVRQGVSLSYEKGPDGRRYAVGGEVSIDTSKEADPSATIAKMRTVRAAALAPAEPSAQDRRVAAAATVKMTNAMSELRLAKSEAENAGNVVGQAVEKIGSRTDGGKSSQDETSVEPAEALSMDVSPRRSWGVQQYYAASTGVQSAQATVSA
ncbi:MAG: hypothetical protein KKD73_12160 [Proteobacteria bacterium]|nr:hypothetical protein [Pseudomonadota bacterium]MBU1640795.1 hypothetical protein [Pseudomonadota bacterium]